MTERDEADQERDRAVEELQKAVRARDEFIAIAAHELRNPMTPILGQVEMLLIAARRAGTACPPGIIASLERLERTVDDYVQRATMLLDLSRITAGKHRLELSDVNVSKLARTAAMRHASAAAHAGCALEVSIEDGVSGLLDEVAVAQIIDNLLSNALKYGAGGPVEVALARRGATAVLRVRDHGIGISKEDQERIFERFERAVTQHEHGGFGIGLWLVRNLVESMGGCVVVASDPGRGSTFTVELPLQQGKGES